MKSPLASAIRAVGPRLVPRVSPIPLRREDVSKVYVLLAAIAVLRFWIMPLRSSFWLDETATFWTACKGIGATLHRVQIAPGQSLAYSLLTAVLIRLGGRSELVLRLPSLAAGLGAACLLYYLGKRLFDRETALLAVVIFASIPEIFKEVPNARPYAIALLFVIASTLQLVRWMDNGRIRNLIAYTLLTSGIIYFHPLLAAVALAHLVYAVVRLRSSAVPWQQVISAAGLIIIFSAPMLWYVLRIQHASPDLVFGGKPYAEALVNSLFPEILATGIFAGLVAGSLFWRETSATPSLDVPFPDMLLLVSWLALPIFTLFLLSLFTPYHVFIPRYFLDAFPALALLVAWGMRKISPPSVRLLVAACIVGAVLVENGTWIGLTNHENWRAAAQAVRTAQVNGDTPVLVRSGLIETRKVAWGSTVSPDSLLLCPTSKYPMPGAIILAPYQLDGPGITYMENISRQVLESAQQFLLVDPGNSGIGLWLQGRFAGRFVARRLTSDSNRVSVLVFRRK